MVVPVDLDPLNHPREDHLLGVVIRLIKDVRPRGNIHELIQWLFFLVQPFSADQFVSVRFLSAPPDAVLRHLRVRGLDAQPSGKFRTKNRGLGTCPQQAKASGGSPDALLASDYLALNLSIKSLNYYTLSVPVSVVDSLNLSIKSLNYYTSNF